MKKQLHKIKIAAENVVSRSTKSERSSDDLVKADKQVERIKDVLDKVGKKFSPNPVSATAGTAEQEVAAREKRTKKVHEHRLALAIEESYRNLPESLLRDVLENCARLERTIADEIVTNEIGVETDVTRRLGQIQDTHLSTIQKQKRIVTKLQQDSDSARHKYQTAIRLNESIPKISQLKEELDECEGKLEKERDIWAAEMFELIVEEESIAAQVTTYVSLQRTYYQNALREIERTMDQMQGFLKENNRRVFKVPLLDHLATSNRTISYVIEMCVCALLEKGLHEEGLLRVGCAGSKLRRMRSAIDANVIAPPLPPEYQDVHVIACVLKSYLRDLPDPLLTDKLYPKFVAASQKPTEAQRKTGILNALHQLPEGNYYNLRYLCRFLSMLAAKSDRNKMSTQNIAIVMSPNLLWSPSQPADVDDYAQKVSSTTSVNTVVEMLVADWDFFFEGDVEFYVTINRDELFRDSAGFPLERDDSAAAIMSKSLTHANGSGVTYLQPMAAHSSNSNSSIVVDHTSPGRPGGSGSHSRSSSHDTSLILMQESQQRMKHSQSNSSLSDQSSPPQADSPKLPMRKKHTKSVAPTPPKGNKKQSKEDEMISSGTTVKPEKPPRPAGMSQECQTLNRLAYKTATKSSAGNGDGSVARPIALPRTTILKEEISVVPRHTRSMEGGLKSSEDEDDVGVVVRGGLAEKPAIPERPASLMRPNFLFKGSLQEVNVLDSNGSGGMAGSGQLIKKAQSFRASTTGNGLTHGSGQPTMERTHIYNVDKQQVEFIDVVGGERVRSSGGGGNGAAPIAEAESYAITTPTDGTQIGMEPPSPRSLALASDAKSIKRPQVPAPPPPTNRPKSQESLGGGGGSETEVTGL